MNLEELNALDEESAARELRRCCGSTRWIDSMVRARPFPSAEVTRDIADAVWTSLDAADWLEAFTAHPRIGETRLQDNSARSTWAEEEQSGAGAAGEDARRRLGARNHQYEERFGYIFIVCATGKSVEEMLAILENRLKNDPREELPIAAEQQRQITRLRLGRLLEAETGGH